MMIYGVSWLEWGAPIVDSAASKKVRKRRVFYTRNEREEFLRVEREKDDFLYVLARWEENVL
jgi:hypothetical protein